MSDPPRSVYDTETDEEDLWFLPGPPEDAAPTDPPWPLADRRPLFDAMAWRRAEAANARALAGAAMAFGALDDRVGKGGAARLVSRLAFTEMAEISWAASVRLSAERIALHEVLRLSSVDEEARDLEQARKGVRRLISGPGPAQDPGAYFGRGKDGAGADWGGTVSDLADLHPFTRACAANHVGQLLMPDAAPDEMMRGVAAARLAATEARAMPFVPVAMGDAMALRRSGAPDRRLPGWLGAIENGCLRALLVLDRIADWRGRADRGVADMSGRSPARLLAVLAERLVVSAEDAAREAGISAAAARRNLAELTRRDIAREVTGQDRYRYWTARL